MKKSIFSLFLANLLVILFSLSAFAEVITCAECGMTLDLASKFTAKIVQGEKTLYFCDIGDLLSYLNRKKPENVRAEVKDYTSGEWLDARAAFFVRSEKTFKSPMGWGIAAFKDGKAAAGFGSVMGFDAAAKAVK